VDMKQVPNQLTDGADVYSIYDADTGKIVVSIPTLYMPMGQINTVTIEFRDRLIQAYNAHRESVTDNAQPDAVTSHPSEAPSPYQPLPKEQMTETHHKEVEWFRNTYLNQS
jgi:hypothetical protein